MYSPIIPPKKLDGGEVTRQGPDGNNKNDESFFNFIDFYVKANDVQKLKTYFIDSPSELNRRDTNGAYPIMHIIQKGSLNMVQAIFPLSQKHKRVKDNQGRGVLFYAVMSGNCDILIHIGKSVTRFSEVDQNGFSLDHYAALLTNHKQAKQIFRYLHNKLDCDLKSNNGYSPLMILSAVSCLDPDTLKTCFYAYCTVANYHALNCMNLALSNGNIAMAKNLKALKSTYQDSTDFPHAFSAALGNIETFEYAEKEPSIEMNIQGKVDGMNIVHYAAEYGEERMVRYLIVKRNICKPQCLSTSGYTPLHYAAKGSSPHVVIELLRLGANVNARGMTDGNTPLHLAAEAGSPYTIRVLLEHGADRNVINSKQQTPLQVAVLKGHVKAKELLQNFQVN